MSARMFDRTTGRKLVPEQRTVLVPVDGAGFYDRPDRRAFTHAEVQAEVDAWGLQPIDLERVRAMLVDLAKTLRPRDVADLKTVDDLARHFDAGRFVTVRSSYCEVDGFVAGSRMVALDGLAHSLEMRVQLLGKPR